MAASTAGLCCCCLSFPSPQTFESIAAQLASSRRGGAAAISADLLKPLSLGSANPASSPSSRRGLTEEQRLLPKWPLSNVGPVPPRRTCNREGDGGTQNRMVPERYEQNVGSPPPQQHERGMFPRPPVVLWEEDFANAVQLIGRVGTDIEIKYLNSGKVVATTSLAVHNGSQRTEDLSWFTLEIWDNLAEIAAHHVAKGELILVAGKIVVDYMSKDDFRCTTVKVVVRDLCFVEPSSDRKRGNSDDEFPVTGASSQFQEEVTSTHSSHQPWNQQQISSQPSQGATRHGHNLARLEAQSPQTRAGVTKWREAATMIDQNRNPSHNVVGGIESRQQNTGSLKVQLKRVGDMKANSTRSIGANDVLEIREPEAVFREEEPISDEGMTGNSVRQDLRTEELLSGRSTRALLKARLKLIAQGRLQSHASDSRRVWSRDSAQRNGSKHKHRAGTTSEAIAFLKSCLQRGITTDSYSYVKALQMCLKQKDLFAAKQVHDCIVQSGMDKNLYVAGNLLNVYIKFGGLVDARRVFNQLEKKSVVDWSNMIAGYAKSDHAESALELFHLMRQEGVEPNEITYLSVLKACTRLLALKWGKDIHECIRLAGLESDIRVGTALLKMYAKCGCIAEARQLFEKMTNRDVITWTVMIGGLAQQGCGQESYRLFLQMRQEGFEPDGFTWTVMIGGLAQDGCGHEAYRMFLQMRQEGFEPDAFTYASILNASASAGALVWVKEVHGHASNAGLESDLRVGTALVHMYAKSGSINDARQVFDRMEKRDVVTWNTMIGAYAEHGRGVESYRLFLQMRREGFEPDAITYTNILNTTASRGVLDWAKEVHGHARKAGLESDLRVGNALVHMYADSGSIDDARRVFDSMAKRDVITWTTMISALGHHGCGHEALALFKKMNADLVQPDGTTFVAVLSACCHGGLVDDGRRLFSAIKQDYGIEPDIFHYTCMVDLLGRAGHVEEAKRFISDMPVEPDVVIWTALLGACRTYGNVELGELAANELFKLEPSKASTYVLLSNIYAAAGKWEKVSLVRTVMEKRGVRKEPGRSWIDVDNKTHEFVVGDKSHPEAEAIYTEINKLTEKMKAVGYIPDTRLVLHDISKEDKELALCSHSEKLAIAYGLLHIPREEPIHIRKNLRVCSDCHTATKFISKVTGREIIARDANRFHHFKDGVCSCGDYW